MLRKIFASSLGALVGSAIVHFFTTVNAPFMGAIYGSCLSFLLAWWSMGFRPSTIAQEVKTARRMEMERRDFDEARWSIVSIALPTVALAGSFIGFTTIVSASSGLYEALTMGLSDEMSRFIAVGISLIGIAVMCMGAAGIGLANLRTRNITGAIAAFSLIIAVTVNVWAAAPIAIAWVLAITFLQAIYDKLNPVH